MKQVAKLVALFHQWRLLEDKLSISKKKGKPLKKSKKRKKTRKLRKPKKNVPSRIPSLLALLKQRRFDEIIEILQFQKQNFLTAWLSGQDEDDQTLAESTALHAVIEYSAPATVIDLMLSKLAEIKRGYVPEASIDKNGQTPLHIAAQKGSDLAVIRRLTAVSELPALTMDALGRFPLHYACLNRSSSANNDVVHHLLDLYPQAVLVEDCSKCTPIDLASKVGQHPQVLLELSMVHRQTVLKQAAAANKPIPRMIRTEFHSSKHNDDVSALGSIGVITLAKRAPTPETPRYDRVRFSV